MRKQTKIAALVSATALLALGASITSFAAARGTWMLVDGEWYCYDSNGDPYEDTFCVSNGKDYYVGEDGMLVRSSWVDYDGDMYFVNSAGQKITSDWRLTTPYDDEDAEEEWYYFQASGKMATNKKIVYKGNTYFFNADGKMLTGWVTAEGDDVVNEENGIDKDHTYYADETGARVEGEWIYTVEPSTAEDDADADYYWYYLLSSGKVATGKRNNIKGQTYLFDSEFRMLSGWVKGVTDEDGTTYYSIDGEDSIDEIENSTVAGEKWAYYYCSGPDDGHVKKDRWLKTWRPMDTYEEDEDVSQYWYWIESDGKVYVPSDANAVPAEKWQLEDGELVWKAEYDAVTKKKVNSRDYFFNENGEMLSQFLYVEDSNNDLKEGLYYFGGSDDGSMKTGAETVKDDNLDSFKFYFETKGTNKGVGITGNKSNKLYYMGHLVAAQDYRYQPVTIKVKETLKDENGEEYEDYVSYTFIVNSNGTIQHSTVEYKEDDDVLIDASGLDKADFESTGAYKYALTSEGLDKLVNPENYPDVYEPDDMGAKINVEYLDPTQIMVVGASQADADMKAEAEEDANTSGNEQNDETKDEESAGSEETPVEGNNQENIETATNEVIIE